MHFGRKTILVGRKQTCSALYRTSLDDNSRQMIALMLDDLGCPAAELLMLLLEVHIPAPRKSGPPVTVPACAFAAAIRMPPDSMNYYSIG